MGNSKHHFAGIALAVFTGKPTDPSYACSLCFSQEVYQQIHPVLFHDRAIYVIVYSLRAEFNLQDLHRHLMNVTIRCKDAPIILVGTHLDAVGGSPSLPLAVLKARYPQVRSPCAGLGELPARSLAYPALLFFVITLDLGFGSRD
jgi:hypothetical protein